jgi:hypothetical protein
MTQALPSDGVNTVRPAKTRSTEGKMDKPTLMKTELVQISLRVSSAAAHDEGIAVTVT